MSAFTMLNLLLNVFQYHNRYRASSLNPNSCFLMPKDSCALEESINKSGPWTVIIAVHMYLVFLSENYSEATVQDALGN